MRILIEEYQYDVAAVKDILHGIDPLTNMEGKVSIHYVGYYYNSLLKDCVFILPKVLLQGYSEEADGQDLVFGKYRPEDIASFDAENPLSLPTVACRRAMNSPSCGGRGMAFSHPAPQTAL